MPTKASPENPYPTKVFIASETESLDGLNRAITGISISDITGACHVGGCPTLDDQEEHIHDHEDGYGNLRRRLHF